MLMRSMLETRGSRLGRGGSLAARFLLAGAICLAAASRAEASPYLATYIGTSAEIHRDYSGFYNNATGGFYAFPDTLGGVAYEDLPNLPTVTLPLPPSDDPSAPKTQTFTMQTSFMNSSGTVIGSFPTKAGEGSFNDPRTTGYTVRSADGQFSPFVPLSNAGFTIAYLSQANRILVSAPDGQRLLDVNTGVTTPIDQVIPPNLLQKYLYGLSGEGIDDRGDVLVGGYNRALNQEEFYILTPPGLDPPAVPEPSTLLIFAAVGLLAARTAARRRKAG